jgi:RimJ/RimL family protein N-acetyltransferase
LRSFHFAPVTETDLPMLAEWLKRPHVAEWWKSSEDFSQLREEFLPLPGDDSAPQPYVAYLEGLPAGYIQSYDAASAGDGWWPSENDPGVRGIDQFLADGQRLAQGLGTQMVREFVQFLFQDPTVTKIQADPAATNLRAIRCYEKAGFRRVGEISTPDGVAMLMMVEKSG